MKRASGNAPQTSPKKRNASASVTGDQAGREIWNSRKPRSYATRNRSRTLAVDSPITPTIGVAAEPTVSSRKTSITLRNRAPSTA